MDTTVPSIDRCTCPVSGASSVEVASAIVPPSSRSTTSRSWLVTSVFVAGRSIAIERPATNTEVTSQDLEVVLRLDGGTIADATSTELAPDTGHVHLSIDGTVVSMTTGLVQSVSLRALDPGEHTLLAEFVAADHAPFDPRVTAGVTFVRGAP